MPLSLPFRVDHRGRTAEVEPEAHTRQLIEALLFTSPGERVDRPELGCGLRDLLFNDNDPELAATTGFMVQAALQRWLGDRLIIDEVRVHSEEQVLHVQVRWRAADGVPRQASFEEALP
ncbi:MAG: GPW/gp25 family protein [Alphaproteobacteria bacterium]|nr:GPW/gp25 family protein [Alphaproteobacteria bacterium]MCB9794942.1 GPW/gp25 family protein [Alphaproteobacteria bacterium]